MNCKQGDLAIVINGRTQGLIVECVEWVGYHEGLTMITGEVVVAHDKWFVRFIGQPIRNCIGELRVDGYCSDSRLRPIRGTPETEHTDQREPVAA